MAQTATIELEYLMTVQEALEAPQTIDAGYGIVGVTGGWADGPKIKAKVVGPGGDWFQVLPSGVAKLDVRLTLMTDDEQLIFVSYNGVVDREVRGTPDAPHIRLAEPPASRWQNGAAFNRTGKPVHQVRYLCCSIASVSPLDVPFWPISDVRQRPFLRASGHRLMRSICK